jgi:GAF domain-containing protein
LVLPLLPLAAAVAILKYRLDDIEVAINKAVVFGTLTVVITAIYAAIVAGIGTLAGRQGSLLLAALAAAVVAVAFQPLRQRAQHLANRVVYGRRATPYEVLSEFSGRAAGAYATEDVLPQMARILAGGTGATSAAVWLATGPELRLSAAWPEQPPGPGAVRLAGDGVPAIPGADGVVPVRHQGQLLGALAVTMPPTEPLTPATEKLVRDLAAQAGLVVRNVRLVEDLLASRQRLVAAQDQERRKLERNLHDGAQQQLVALTVKQRLAADLVRQDPDQAIAMLTDLRRGPGEPAGTRPGDLPAAAGRPRAGASPRIPRPEKPRAGCDPPRRRPVPPAGGGRRLLLLPGGHAKRGQIRPSLHGPHPPGRRRGMADLLRRR